MSLDNGIYILKLRREGEKEFEYRVAHAFAIENIFKDMGVLHGAFEDCTVFDNFSDARDYAAELDMELLTEHDIRGINHFANLTWNNIREFVTEEKPIGELDNDRELDKIANG